MNLVKENLNKFDSILKENFGYDNVNSETIDGFNYYFMVENSGMAIRINLPKDSILTLESGFIWNYNVDTNDVNSMSISRVSTLSNISESIFDIFKEKRFAKSYLESFSLNENVNTIDELKDAFMIENGFCQIDEEFISSKLDELGVDYTEFELNDNELCIRVNKMKLAKKFDIEQFFKNYDMVEDSWVTDTYIKVILSSDLDCEIKK